MDKNKDNDDIQKPDEKSNPGQEILKQLEKLMGSKNVKFEFQPNFGAAEPAQPSAEPEPDSNEILNKIRHFSMKPREIRDYLNRFVIKQDEAKKVLSTAICDHYNHVRRCLENPSLNDAEYAKQNILILGPTGVGKTYLAKILAEQMFGNQDALIQIDMSEYMEKFSISRLIGSPPGYIGHEDGGQLTERVRRNPYSVILFDEIEKAHPDVAQILLQVLEDGRLTDSLGRTVDFRNTIIILTSNVGADILQKKSFMGFGVSEEQDFEKVKQRVFEEMKKSFRPEFLNRIGDIVLFRNLDKDSTRKIVRLEIKKLEDRLSDKGMGLVLDEDAVDFLISKGWDEKFGARPLKRAIARAGRSPRRRDS